MDEDVEEVTRKESQSESQAVELSIVILVDGDDKCNRSGQQSKPCKASSSHDQIECSRCSKCALSQSNTSVCSKKIVVGPICVGNKDRQCKSCKSSTSCCQRQSQDRCGNYQQPVIVPTSQSTCPCASLRSQPSPGVSTTETGTQGCEPYPHAPCAVKSQTTGCQTATSCSQIACQTRACPQPTCRVKSRPPDEEQKKPCAKAAQPCRGVGSQTQPCSVPQAPVPQPCQKYPVKSAKSAVCQTHPTPCRPRSRPKTCQPAASEKAPCTPKKPCKPKQKAKKAEPEEEEEEEEIPKKPCKPKQKPKKVEPEEEEEEEEIPKKPCKPKQKPKKVEPEEEEEKPKPKQKPKKVEPEEEEDEKPKPKQKKPKKEEREEEVQEEEEAPKPKRPSKAKDRERKKRKSSESKQRDRPDPHTTKESDIRAAGHSMTNPKDLNYSQFPTVQLNFVDYFLKTEGGVNAVITLSELKLEFEGNCKALLTKISETSKVQAKEFFLTVLEAVQVHVPDSNNTEIKHYHLMKYLHPIVGALGLSADADMKLIHTYHQYILAVTETIDERMRTNQVINPDALVDIETHLLAGIMSRLYPLFIKFKDRLISLSNQKSSDDKVSAENMVKQLKKLILAMYVELVCIDVTFTNTLTSMSYLPSVEVQETYRHQFATRLKHARHSVTWGAKCLAPVLLFYYAGLYDLR